MTNLKKYRKDRLTDIENRNPKTQGFDASPDPNKKNKLPETKKPITYSQVRKEEK